ncbi:MAG TPA: glucose 1-dehydrogenase [Acidimicrobiales bacterium]|nr:glucose 1-dehydrogenase [Acidimicrobiales bacterium]
MGALDRFRLDGQVAVVTGAGRGIGAGCARVYAEAGADVVLAARTLEQLESVAEEIRAHGRRAVVVPGDVNDLDFLAELVDRAVTDLGGVDQLVNNAGGGGIGPMMSVTAEELEAQFHFNVTTAFELTKLCVPHMLVRGKGSVVNISSFMGRRYDRGYVAYATSKAALSHLTRCMSADCAPKIRVNGIHVGSIATSALEGVLTMPELRDEMIAKTPLGFVGTPEDIGLCALYLASDAGRYLTGKMIECDGGTESSTLDLRIPDLV